MKNPWSEESRKRARKKWRQSERGKAWDKAYLQRPEVKARRHVENELLFPEGCAIKYICRHRLKGKKEDILKAIHFLEMILERDYKEIEKPKKETKQTSNSWGIIK